MQFWGEFLHRSHTHGMPTVLLLTARADIEGEVSRLAAVAGLPLTSHGHVDAASAAWSSCDLVLIGIDLLPAVAAKGWPRRSSVLVVTVGESVLDSDVSVWVHAVEQGAEHVVELPKAERWLVDRLGDVADGPSAEGALVSVHPGRGGVGATTLSCLLAHASPVSTLLIDADALSGGIDVRLGLDEESGVRWSDLHQVSGRISPAALRPALVSLSDHAVVLAADRMASGSPTAGALEAVMLAGHRGFDLTIVDCPRACDETTRLVWSRSQLAVVVVPCDLPGAVASASLIESVRRSCAHVAIVARTPTGEMAPEEIADALEVPLLGVLPDDRRIAHGEWHLSRATRRVTNAVLGQVLSRTAMARGRSA